MKRLQLSIIFLCGLSLVSSETTETTWEPPFRTTDWPGGSESVTQEPEFSTEETTTEWTTSPPDFQEFVCTMNEAGYCVFKFVNITADNYRFLPISENISVSDVKKILFEDSILEVFGPDICQTFPNLEHLAIDNTQCEFLTFDALEKCNNLIVFSARQNRLSFLDNKAFDGLKQVEIIRLLDNRLESIPVELISNLRELRVLELQNNLLTEFSTEIVSKNCNLQELRLDGNELMDLDVESMAEAAFGRICLHNLWVLGFDDNNFNCHRIPNIVKTLNNRRIGSPKAFLYKFRSYSTRTVDGYKCLGDVEWGALYLKQSNLKIMKEMAKVLREDL